MNTKTYTIIVFFTLIRNKYEGRKNTHRKFYLLFLETMSSIHKKIHLLTSIFGHTPIYKNGIKCIYFKKE